VAATNGPSRFVHYVSKITLGHRSHFTPTSRRGIMRDRPISPQVRSPQAPDSYRVIMKDNGEDIETGSIGTRFGEWRWGIDKAIPMREFESEGTGKNLPGCQKTIPRGMGTARERRSPLKDFIKIKRAARRR
jgi:hypothetical protein